MSRTRKLASALFFGVLVIFGTQLRASAQVEQPGNLGENAGTGNASTTGLRKGYWELVKIETSVASFGHSLNPVLFPRQRKDLPLDTRERRGKIMWGRQGSDRRITADVVFRRLKEKIEPGNIDDSPLSFLVTAEVKGKGIHSESPRSDITVFRCAFDVTTPSKNEPVDLVGTFRSFEIYAGSYFPNLKDPFYASRKNDIFSKKGEFACGTRDYKAMEHARDQFTLNYYLLVDDGGRGYDGDVGFHFTYRWYDNPVGTRTSTGDAGAEAAKPKLKVEDIPEDYAGSNSGAATDKSNKPLTVEEIPEDRIPAPPSGVVNSSNQGGSNQSPPVKSGRSSLPPNVVVAANGQWEPAPGYEWAGTAPDDYRVRKKKKPKDGPGFWEKLGTAINQTATQPPQQPQQPTNPGGGGGNAAGLNMSGRWGGVNRTYIDGNLWDEVVWQIDLRNTGASQWGGSVVLVRAKNPQNWRQIEAPATLQHLGNGRCRLYYVGQTVDGTCSGSRFSFMIGDTEYAGVRQ